MQRNASRPAGRAPAAARLLAIAAAAITVGAATPTSAGAATIEIETNRRGEFVEIRATATVAVDAATAWRVLTAYDEYPRFIPDLRQSRVLARRGSVVTVEQSGDARLWWLHIPLEVTFEITESPPGSVQSRAVAGSMRALESRYVLSPLASGVALAYTGRVAPGYPLFGPLEEFAVRQNVTRQFRALVNEIERSGTPRP